MGVPGIVIADTVTKLGADAAGQVAIAASHAGIYAAHVALEAKVAGVVLNDAGIGLDEAGIAGLGYLDTFSVPAAAIDFRSARIGDGDDSAARGIISRHNAAAAELGVRVGMTARQAAEHMRAAPRRSRVLSAHPEEARLALTVAGAQRPVWLLDSASLIAEGDVGAVVVTGSHGGLLGGKAATAAKVDVFAAVYNDAGIGADRAGVSRLPALDARGIAAATVAASSARIGDARSAYETGRLSLVNATAARLGAQSGMTTRAFVELVSRIPSQEA
ncbi:conserved hypothetical protein [Hyphomicrobiales bacterium]|nr:conserved hypothetical protein [Hyphomicrobiales bacterium]CAH1693598.1 conserved hypothetical protein [Hyphomicrobiales bacterium]